MGLALDELEENEKPVQVNGIDVLVKDFVRPFLEGKSIDYINQPDSEGFIITGSAASC